MLDQPWRRSLVARRGAFCCNCPRRVATRRSQPAAGALQFHDQDRRMLLMTAFDFGGRPGHTAGTVSSQHAVGSSSSSNGSGALSGAAEVGDIAQAA